MTASPSRTLSRGVRRINLNAYDITLSALLCEPERAAPRAAVVALHGAGLSAGYFDGQAHPHQSLLLLGAELGFTVLALDRPGYGGSAGALPGGQLLADQAVTLRAALKDFAARYDVGAGVFLLAHSFGGKLALTAAAGDEAEPELLGLDISGCGHRYAAAAHGPAGAGSVRRNWGPLRLYPPDTFRSSGALVHSVPERERHEAERWPELFPGLARRVRVPVRLTFAEHESWWRHDGPALVELRSHLAAAPRVLLERQPGAGHNISLGWAARPYHLRAFGFLEDCLLGRESTTSAKRSSGTDD